MLQLSAREAVETVLSDGDPQREAVLRFAHNLDSFLRTRGDRTIESAIERTEFYIRTLQELAIDQNLIEHLIPRTLERSSAMLMLGLAAKVRTKLYESLHKIYGTRQVGKELRESMRQFYGFLAENNSQRRHLSVFTTNYDVALNAIFGECERTPGSASSCTSEVFTGVGRYEITVKRLHGCVDWCFENAENVKYEFALHDEWTKMVVKVGSGTDRLMQMPFRTAYADFQGELTKRGAVCVVIGFGFHDADLCRCIYRALVDARVLRGLVVVDKQLGIAEVKSKLLGSPGFNDHKTLQRIEVCKMAIEDSGCAQTILKAVDKVTH
jgi:hypothetical protein